MANSKESSSSVIHEGVIFKKGQINKSWKERWFVLYNGRRLAYFEKKTDNKHIKEIDLSDVQSINVIPRTSNSNSNNNTSNNGNNEIENKKKSHTLGANDDDSKLVRTESISVASVTSDRANSFELVTPKRRYLLSCKSDIEMDLWIDYLEKEIFGGRLYQGWLTKRGAYRKSWKKRWFVIYDTQEMRYYDDSARLSPKGLIKLHEVLLMCPGDKDQYTQPYTIQLMTPDRNWVLAAQSQKERDEWFARLEETIHGAKRLITSFEGYLWKRGQVVRAWKKRFFALSKGWLFYFEEQFHCNKFKSIAFFSEAFFNQAFRLYVKGSIPLHQTTIKKVDLNDEEYNAQISKESAQNKVFNDDDCGGSGGLIANNEMKQYVFKIMTDKREFEFACDTQSDLNKWFKAFHSTHNANVDYDGMSGGDVVSASNGDDDDCDDDNDDDETFVSADEYDDSDILSGLTPNGHDNDDDDDGKYEDDDDAKKSEIDGDRVTRGNSRTPLLDILDPKGNGQWVDIEAEHVEKQTSHAIRSSKSKKKKD